MDYVVTNYKTTRTLGYNNTRDTMYAVIDLKEGNQLSCVYSGYTITLDLNEDPSSDAYSKGINAEHTWPQSMGASSEPQKSDLHHLFPCKSNVNSSRSNDPFAEIIDEDTDKWYRNDEVLTSIPTQYIDKYVEKENDNPHEFEPREIHKGDAARAMFYFFAMYQDAADTSFWNTQKDVLLQWHYYDPVDEWEYNITWAIAGYQDNKPNPFVLDSTLARRIWLGYTIEVQNNVAMPEEIVIYPNYPNPFNSITTISYDLPMRSNVVLTIYDILGRQVKMLGQGVVAPGFKSVVWDGKDDLGKQVSSGVYFFQIHTENLIQIKKIVLLR